MDGLLLDSERMIMAAWLDSAAALGVPLSQGDFLHVVGLGSTASRNWLTRLFGSEALFEHVGRAAAAQLAAGPDYPLKPGALALLQDLQRRGVPCAVASSTGIETVRRRLAAVDVLPLLQAAAGGDEVAHTKPDPAVYLLAAARLGLPPAQCLAFEDSDHGAQAATAAGMHVIVVPDLKTPEACSTCLHLPSLEAALTLVEQWFPAC